MKILSRIYKNIRQGRVWCRFGEGILRGWENLIDSLSLLYDRDCEARNLETGHDALESEVPGKKHCYKTVNKIDR